MPHEREESSSNGVKFLNINRELTALTVGCVDASKGCDVLFVGTTTNLLAYDVINNSDLFYKDVPDGCTALAFGVIPGIQRPLAVVGGNCSIQGFDSEGSEAFWTVTGDVVSAMEFIDVNGDGTDELVVASCDYEMRVFAGDDVLSEVTETDTCNDLAPLGGSLYGYCLQNGTAGIYYEYNRVWRVKSKHAVNAVGAFDLNADGEPELISGWANGKIEVRSAENGKLVYKDHLRSGVAAIVTSDYRLDGREEVICCSKDGELRAYLPVEAEEGALLLDAQEEDAEITALTEAKAALEMELRSIEQNITKIKSGEQVVGAIPADAHVEVHSVLNAASQCVDLVVSVTSGAVIKCVNIFCLDAGIFDGESLVHYPHTAESVVRVQLRPPSNTPVALKLQVCIGARGSSAQFLVQEIEHTLPRFATFERIAPASVPRSELEALGRCEFEMSERLPRVALWISQSFYAGDAESLLQNGEVAVLFRDVESGSLLWITASSSGRACVACKRMETAGEVMQDMCGFLSLKELESTATFEDEMNEFRQVLMRVDEYNHIRLKLTAEMADVSNEVKSLVIRCEDSRILGDMNTMEAKYTQLLRLNEDLVTEYRKRATNHEALLANLKLVNKMIQTASKLRSGSCKTRVVTLCRNAIKENNIHQLFHIIQYGVASSSS